MTSMFEPVCPECRTPLANSAAWEYQCPTCGARFEVCGTYLQPLPDPVPDEILDLTDGVTSPESATTAEA